MYLRCCSLLLIVLALPLAGCSHAGPGPAMTTGAANAQVALAALALTATPEPTPTPTPTATPTPTPLPTAAAAERNATREDCPVTQPPDPAFIPPEPYPSEGPSGDFWYGSEDLWTLLPVDATWRDLPLHDDHIGQKTVWFRKGYVWTDEPEPALDITGRRLDGKASFETRGATNGFHEDLQSFMLAGVGLPSYGCWEITGHYHGHELSYVVWVAP